MKADQKARGRYLGGNVPFGFRRGEDGELVPHEAEQEAIREMVALRAQGRPLRAIADAVRAKGVRISHEGVAGVLKARQRSAEIVRAFPFRFAGELDAFAASSGTWRPLDPLLLNGHPEAAITRWRPLSSRARRSWRLRAISTSAASRSLRRASRRC